MAPAGEIMAHLLQSAVEARRDSLLSDDAVRIRGAWNTSYVIELAPTSSRLHLHYVVIQTIAQGCCYYEPAVEAPGVRDALLGADALTTDLGGGACQIAALDAVYAQLCRTPDERVTLDGSNIDKAVARAEVLNKEASRLLERATSLRSKLTIVNVGVVGDFIAALGHRNDVMLTASDYYHRIVGQEVGGVVVQHGSMTPELVADADVAIVTGMTLATGTLDEIFTVARENSTAVILFAQTGSHFAEAYLGLGAAAVLAEPLPFYLSGDGVSRIDIFRQPA